jgi:hypothetical protein
MLDYLWELCHILVQLDCLSALIKTYITATNSTIIANEISIVELYLPSNNIPQHL